MPRREPCPAQHALYARPNTLDVAFGSHLEHQPAFRLQRARHAFHNQRCIAHPVQRGVGKDTVEWIVEAKGPCVCQLKLQFRKVLPRLRDHRGR